MGRPIELLLVRHGEAVDRAAALCEDEDRWLTEKGRSVTAKMGKWLRQQADRPTMLWTSPLARCVQTAEILAHACQISRVFTVRELAPGRDIEVWHSLVADFHGRGVLGVVGHEPQLSGFASRLVRSDVPALKKSSLVRIDVGVRAKLCWTQRPKDLGFS